MLWMLLMLSLNPEVKAGCKTNGCNVWNIVPYKTLFTPACDKHDICYACGVDHGWNRKQCDMAFKHDMANLCDNGSKIKWLCKLLVAGSYYKAVRLFGGKYWKDPSSSWCKTCPKVLEILESF